MTPEASGAGSGPGPADRPKPADQHGFAKLLAGESPTHVLADGSGPRRGPADMATMFATWAALSRRERVRWRGDWICCQVVRPYGRPFAPRLLEAEAAGIMRVEWQRGEPETDPLAGEAKAAILRFGEYTLLCSVDKPRGSRGLATVFAPGLHGRVKNPPLSGARFLDRHGVEGRTTMVGGQGRWAEVGEALLDLATLAGTDGYALVPADDEAPPEWSAISEGAIVADPDAPLSPDPALAEMAARALHHAAASTLASGVRNRTLPHTAMLPASAMLRAARRRDAAARLAAWLEATGADTGLVAMAAAAGLSRRPA